MEVMLSALRAGRDLLPRKIIVLLLVLISVRGWVKLGKPQRKVRPEGLGTLKKKIHSSQRVLNPPSSSL
jgi:hypothetical protein